MNSSILISNLSKIIKGKIILSNISLEIQAGTINGFVGANGSGKTMLFRAIAGFLSIPDGSIAIDKSAKKGVIIENPSFINSFTGIDNLKYLASINRKITNDHIIDVMENVRLDPKDTRQVRVYSLGMKQKLAVAQAVMESPDILILDEPTRGLDAESIACVHNLIRQHQRRGVTVLIASHSKDDISDLCENVYALDNGTLSKVF